MQPRAHIISLMSLLLRGQSIARIALLYLLFLILVLVGDLVAFYIISQHRQVNCFGL